MIKLLYEIQREFYDALEEFGYQNIDVILYNHLNGMKIYLWDGEYGYNLYVSFSDLQGSPLLLTDAKNAENLRLFKNFFARRVSLREYDLRMFLKAYLSKIGILDIKTSASMDRDGGTMWFFKDDFRCQITLQRKNAVNVYMETRHYAETEEPFEEFETFDNHLEIESIFREKLTNFGAKNYELKLNEDLLKLDLLLNESNISCRLKINLYSFTNWALLSGEDVQRKIFDIIYVCWTTCCNEYEDPYTQFYSNLDNHVFVDPKNNKYALIFIEDIECLIHICFNQNSNVDLMDGVTFERFCAEVLASNGFRGISLTQGSGDQGVDIIAYKDDIKYGFQCKCYSADIGNKAVQEVFAGKTYYHCHVGVVLTNRYFTKSAIDLAKSNGIILWDREKMFELIEVHRQKCLSV